MADFTGRAKLAWGSDPQVGDVMGRPTNPWVAKFTITSITTVINSATLADRIYYFNGANATDNNTTNWNQAITKSIGVYSSAVQSGVAGVITLDGSPLSGVDVLIAGGSATTNSYGEYEKQLSIPFSGTAVPGKAGYSFSPVSKTYSGLTVYRSDENYIAGLLPSQPTNFNPVNYSEHLPPYPTQLSWTPGANAVSFDVQFGLLGNMTKVSSKQGGSSWTISPVLEGDKVYQWQIDSYNSLDGKTTGASKFFNTVIPPPEKPINPAPEDTETKVNKTTTDLTWVDGGYTDTFNVSFGTESSNLTEIMTAIPVGTPLWPSPMVVLEINDYNPAVNSGYRSPIAGDVLTHGDTTYYVYKVERGDLINVQYEAKLYAFRIGAPYVTGDTLTNGVSPDIENPQAVSVTLNNSWHFHGEVESAYYPYATRYYWRVDAVGEGGTTTGDEWYFDIEGSFLNERPPNWNGGGGGDWQWVYYNGEYQWIDIDVAGGGRYKLNLVAVGHNCIYVSS